MNKITKCLFLLGALMLVAFGCAPVAKFPSSPHVGITAGLPQLRGTNLTGGDVDYGSSNTTNPVSGTDYLFVSHQDIDYLTSKGVGFVRLVFSWEVVQPTLNGPLASVGAAGTYVTTFADRVSYATSKGMYVMIEPHGAGSGNFAKYKGNLVGTTAVPNSAFADLWSRLATQFKGNTRVIFGLTNEPHDMSTAQWFQAAQAAVLGIRATGATNLILVPGNGFTSAESWTSNYYDTASTKVSNATAFKQYINDPLGNTGVSVHMYFDQNSGGGANDIVSPTIGVERVKVTVDWARANGVKVHLGEFGTVSSPQAQVAVKNLLDYLNANQDVVIGWSWWTYGSPAWWGSYQFTLDPSSNYTVDAPQMAWLTPYFATTPTPSPPPTPTPTPAPGSSFPTNPIAFNKNTVFTIVAGGVTNWVYVPTNYDSTHNTPTTLLVWLHGCGGQSQYDISMVSPGGSQSYIALAVGGQEGNCWNVNGDTAKVLAALADIKTHFNVNPRHVILGGYSSGGDLTYRTAFYNASLFAGVIVENSSPFRDTGSSQATSLAAASWKFNTVQLSHTSDSTYPPGPVQTELAAMTNAGFPTKYIERPGTHYDSDNGAFGTAYDLRTYLLPYLDAAWSSPGGVTPIPTPCVWNYSVWGACQSNSTQARTANSTPVGCVGTPTLIQACVYTPPPPPACVYAYTAWSACQSNSTQVRTVTSSAPSGCVGTPIVTQACVYTPPALKPLIVSKVKTYDWQSGYCVQFAFKNPNNVPVSWKTMTIYLKDGRLRGSGAVWGATFPNPSASGNLVVTPIASTDIVKANATIQTVGFCADYGPSHYVGTNGGLAY